MASQPWTLFDVDPSAGGGGGGNPVGANGFPEATPLESMSAEHQAAYWKYHARRHEAAVKASPDAAELERLRAADAELATRKAADLSETDRLKAEKDAADAATATARAEADAANRRVLLLEVAAEKHLTPAQAARLQGATRDELIADADALKADFAPAGGTPPAPLSGGNRGGNVKPSDSVQAGEDLWAARNPKN
ncbi:hypothetical protein A6A07_07400 [Streptomyces sp. CB03911]|nr:hypothetical protein A6A07_07400 [Streptomyces sp. CB03911]